MRKLRRLPWRIPKQHHAQPAPEAHENAPRIDEEREARRERERELQNSQPVAFAGGRYVYGCKPSLPRANTEIRRNAPSPDRTLRAGFLTGQVLPGTAALCTRCRALCIRAARV